MDIEFVVQDIFALTRPQWKLASNIDEASKAFHLAVAQDQKTSGVEKPIDPDEGSSEPSSEDEIADDLAMHDEDGDESESEEEEAEVCPRITCGLSGMPANKNCIFRTQSINHHNETATLRKMKQS